MEAGKEEELVEVDREEDAEDKHPGDGEQEEGIERMRKPAAEDEKPPKPLGGDCYRSELRSRCVRPPTCLKASSLSTSTSSDHNKHIIIIIPIATMVIIAININTSQFPKPLAFGSGNPL